jgi:mannose-6-phosphate isomerase-like protein (cupin superfamily)
MAEYRSTRIDDIEAIYGGSMKRARSALDVTAFGLQVMDIPPNATGYPEHDHSTDGQEEVYVTLRGSATLDIEGTPVTLDPDHLVSVKSGTRRKVVPGDAGVRILVIGGVPGEAYAPAQWTEVGTPDPGAS